MDEGGSRIRRRVSVRKRTRSGPESAFHGPAAAELGTREQEEPEEPEEPGAGGRRRKTSGLQPLEHNESDEDMFGDYDSFAENSFLAQVDDLEQKYQQICDHSKDSAATATEDLCSENVQCDGLITAVDSSAELDMNEQTKDPSKHQAVSNEPEADVLYDMPSSQVLYFENLQNFAGHLGDSCTAAREGGSSSHKAVREELSGSSVAHPLQADESSSKVRTSSDVNRRKSLTDFLKSAMAGNAKVQTPVFSRTKQLKETLLAREISAAQETIESSSDDLGPFYSLPSKVRDLYAQFKGIEKLYGNAF